MTDPNTAFAIGACLGALSVLFAGVLIDHVFKRRSR